jgi:signal transduction histidine kinase
VWVATFYVLGDTSQYITQLFPTEKIPLANAASLAGFIGYIGLVAWYFESLRKRAEDDLVNANAEIALQKDQLEEKNQLITSINLHLEDLVLAKTKDLEEKSEELDTFLYQSSHALRRPVARASGLVNLIRPGISPQEMEFIRSKTELTYAEMDRLLRKLVLISEVFQRKVQVLEVRLADWLPRFIQTFELQYGLASGTIQLGEIPTLSGKTDLKLLEVALFEVLNNCLIYTKTEEEVPQIRVKLSLVGEHLQILIEDSGMGIQEAFMPQVFKLFSRGTVRGGGAGLGLYLAKNALAKLNGNIEIKTSLGVGTQAFISIPTFFFTQPNNPEGES